MALEAGVVSITLEFAKDLKDRDWFGKQDPYCIVKVGGQTFRTKTATDGGKNPVWNETFRANLINENTVEVEIKDEDVGRDDTIGVATFTLAKAREAGRDRLQVPVQSKKSRKQHGFISVALSWEPSRRAAPPAAAPAAPPPHMYAMPPAAQAPAPPAAAPTYYPTLLAPPPVPYFSAPHPAAGPR